MGQSVIGLGFLLGQVFEEEDQEVQATRRGLAAIVTGQGSAAVTVDRTKIMLHLSQVIEGPINFFSLCEHHAFPFFGHAYVGYIAHENILGISKLTRLVRLFAKRFAVQERIGHQIADALGTMLHPHGVAIYLEAHHLCMEMRGVREVAPMTRTTVWRGHYADDPALRAEFFTACGLQR